MYIVAPEATKSQSSRMFAVWTWGLHDHSFTRQNAPMSLKNRGKSHNKFRPIQLTSTAGNYSVNLSGFLILGMTMSAAVTMWAYLQTALAKTKKTPHNYGNNHGHHQGYHQPEYSQGYDQGYGNEVYKKEAPQGSNQKQRVSIYMNRDVT